MGRGKKTRLMQLLAHLSLGINFSVLEMTLQKEKGGEGSVIFAPVESSLMSTILIMVKII